MPVPAPAVQVETTQPLNFIFGLYRLSRWTIPYFITRMSLRQAADDLRLVSEFPGVERTAWKLEELYQRDIDWTRVQKQIVPYLRADDHPQFFNALTMALLPIRGNEVASTFDGSDWTPPPIGSQDIPVENEKHIGAITLGYYGQWTDPTDSNAELGQIRWNPREVFSVAIDGQHRLAAIKQLAQQLPGRHSPIDVSKVPVILLVLDPKLGYQGVGNTPILEVLRRLFIDLNKHAVPVDRTRRILLDDYDPHSLCVRSIVESSLSANVDIGQPLTTLPLCLVDWHTGEAKVDRGPYLTTVLGLDWAVSKVLGVQPVRDYMDYDTIRKHLKAFKSSLGLNLPHALARLEEIEDLSVKPFSYQQGRNGELEQIRSAFATVWSPAFVSLFTKLGPYAEVIAERAANGTLTAEFTNWYYLFIRASGADSNLAQNEYANLAQHLLNRDQQPVSEDSLKSKLADIEELKKSIAYLVVFQRAFVEAFWQFEKLDIEAADDTAMADIDLDVEDWPDAQDSPDGTSITARATRVAHAVEAFIEALNQVWKEDKHFLQKELSIGSGDDRRLYWQGALLDLDGSIDFTLGASSRSAELILWIPLLAQLKQANPSVTKFRQVMEMIADEDNTGSVVRVLRRSLERYRRGGALRIEKAEHDDFLGLPQNEQKDRLDTQIKPRLKWAWDQVCKSPT